MEAKYTHKVRYFVQGGLGADDTGLQEVDDADPQKLAKDAHSRAFAFELVRYKDGRQNSKRAYFINGRVSTREEVINTFQGDPDFEILVNNAKSRKEGSKFVSCRDGTWRDFPEGAGVVEI